MSQAPQSIEETKLNWLPRLPIEQPTNYRLKNYDIERINRRIARKYLNRHRNLLRSWIRICTHTPETTVKGSPKDILEFSTAHGAMLELWRALGHNVHGTDYAMDPSQLRAFKPLDDKTRDCLERSHSYEVRPEVPGWIYQPIIESLNLDVTLFDASKLPYPFEDNSFDIVVCYQAIDAYAEPYDWTKITDEFCRIARSTVVIGFNATPIKQPMAHSAKGWEALRTYNRNGFRNIVFEIEHSRRGYHPTACRLEYVGV